MLKETSEQLIGNDRFEGFCIDLIHEIATDLGFNYTFQVWFKLHQFVINNNNNNNFIQTRLQVANNKIEMAWLTNWLVVR